MSTVIQFLQAVSDFFATVFDYDVIPGVSLFTFLLFNLLIVIVFSVTTRRS